MLKKVSVIIPAYNAEKYIDTPINSLKNQTFKDFEVIIVDDGSTDKTFEVINKLISDDKRFRIITQSNNGPGSARNNGIENSKGEFVVFLDSDDYYDKTFLEKMIKKQEAECSDIVICDFAKVDEEKSSILNKYINAYTSSISSKEAFIDIMQSLNITSISPNKLFKVELFKNVRYPENIVVNEDSATIYRLILNAKKISFVNEILFFYVQQKTSSMNSFNINKLNDRLIAANLVKEYFISNDLIKDYEKMYKIYYLLNVVLSGSLQVVRQSNEWENNLARYLSKIDNRIFNFESIMLLYKNHKKKFLALFILKISKSIFRYLSLKQ